MANTIEAMQMDGIWDAGAQLHCLESALKPSLVSTKPQAFIRQECKQVFEPDVRAIQNPAGKMELDPVCHMKCAGLCMTDPCFHRVDAISKNLFAVVKRRKLTLPVLLK
eukprot:7033354-Pyramimonas_sp.AAC.1